MRFCICIDAADGKQAYSVRTCTKLKFVRDIFCLFLPFSSLHSLSCSLFSSFSTLLLNLFIWVFFNCAHHSLAHSSTSFSLSIEFFLLIFVHTAQMCEFRSSIGWTVKYSISIWLSNERSKSLPCTNTRTLLLFFLLRLFLCLILQYSLCILIAFDWLLCRYSVPFYLLLFCLCTSAIANDSSLV